MDLSDIDMLEAIVKHGSIVKATEVLHVTQPTLSKRLSRLEYTLGTVLFERSSTGLTPTQHTKFIIESSQQIKNKVRNIERHIELMNMLEAGDLKIGVGPIVEQLYFPHVILELTKSKSASLNLSIRTEMAEDLAQLLVDGVIDIAIGPFEESSASDQYQIYPIASQPLIIAVRAGHPLEAIRESGEPLTVEDIFEYTLISPHVPAYMNAQAPYLDSIENSRVVCDNYSVVKEVLKESDHISIGPSAVFSQEVQQGSLKLLPMPAPIRWHASCITRPESACLPVIEKVIETFRRYELPSVEAN